MADAQSGRRFSILLLGTQMAAGGAQKMLLEQGDWYSSHGHDVIAAFFYDRDGLESDWRQKTRFPLHNLRAYVAHENLLSAFQHMAHGLRALWALLTNERVDAIITFTHDSNMIGLPLAWLARVPARIATHLGGIGNLPRWRQFAHTWVVNLGFANVLVAASKTTRAIAMHEGIRAEKIVVIPNGIKPLTLNPSDISLVRQTLRLTDADILLVAVGRLVYEKGHEFLVRAMADVATVFPQAKALICGDGPLKQELQTQIAVGSLVDCVKLLGYWEDVSALLGAANLFILPSRSEGLPLALLEGMSAGLPVIATRVPGADEVIEDGVQGLLIPTSDSAALSKAIIALLSDPQRMREMGAAGRLRMQQGYTIDHMCNHYSDLIDRILQPAHDKD